MKLLILSTLLILITPIFSQDKYDTLKITSGKEYINVVVRGHSIEGVKIVHSTGATTIPWDSLPIELREKYKLSDEELETLKIKQELSKQQFEREKQLAKLKASSKEDRFKILSIDPSGGGMLVQSIIAEAHHIPGSSTNSVGGGGTPGYTYYTYTGDGDLYWVSGMPAIGLVDGYKFKMKFVDNGTHSYNTVQGSYKTVKNLRYISHSSNLE